MRERGCRLLFLFLFACLALLHGALAETGTDLILGGVISTDGEVQHKIPSSDVPGISGNGTCTSSFYVSLSVYLGEDATEHFRGIFFKGRDNTERTPSIWLVPHTNQVTYRVMGEQGEVWATSRRELKLESWSHLVLTFGKKMGSKNFVMRLYIDGEIDSEIELRSPPVLNDADFLLGKDVGATSKGFVGLLSQLEVGTGGESFYPLLDCEVRQKFASAARNLRKITRRDHSLWTCQREADLADLVKPGHQGVLCPTHDDDAVDEGEECSIEGKGSVFEGNWELLRKSHEAKGNEKIPAILQLAWKNWLGLDQNPKSCHTALFYMQMASSIASTNYQRPGQQFSVEEVLLSERVHQSRQDNAGTDADDSWALKTMAEGGSADAALTLANRHFYGHNGFPKNMTEALSYFKMAHDLGSDVGSIALAKMLLRGDLVDGAAQGGGQRAIELYQGITTRSVDRLHLSESYNGLGFAHFYGKGGLEPNRTEALANFEEAASLGSSQGALNAALILNDEDPGHKARAVEYFKVAAKNSALANHYLGQFKAYGEGGEERNCSSAFEHFWQMAKIGPWANELSTGLKSYLDGDLDGAYAAYKRAAQLGYSIAGYNILFLLDSRRSKRNNGLRRLLGRDEGERFLADDPADTRVVLEDVILGGVEATDVLKGWAHQKLGDCYLFGDTHGCAEAKPTKAVEHYEEAVLRGNVAAYFSLGDVHFFGADGVERNETEAFRLFRQGHERSGRELASLLALGSYSILSVLGFLKRVLVL